MQIKVKKQWKITAINQKTPKNIKSLDNKLLN